MRRPAARLLLTISILTLSAFPAPEAAAQQQAQPQPAVCPAAQASDAPRAARLPVRRVILYKNGIGYFSILGE
jgi:hypothetical protein